jgi:hypothetical protein
MSYWAVAQTETRREHIARQFLMRAGFITYCPRIKRQGSIVPLFPSYLFIQIESAWYQARWTVGIRKILMSGEVPGRTAKLALIFNPRTAPYGGMLRSIEAAAPTFVVDITTRGVADAAELKDAIATAGRDSETALVVFPDVFTATHQEQIHRTRDGSQAPGDLSLSLFRRRGRPDVVWHRYSRSVSPNGGLS